MWNCNTTSLHYLGDKAFCDVLVGEVRGLAQLAGERGVGLVKGLPTDPWRGEVRKDTLVGLKASPSTYYIYYYIYFLVPRNI